MGKKVITNIDLFNMLRENKNSTYLNRIPEATRTNIDEVNAKMADYKPGMNEMTGEIVTKIAEMIFADFDDFVNPLAYFKKGTLPYGTTIEEVYKGLLPARAFDQVRSETDVLKRVIPEIHTLYHSENSELEYKTTISVRDVQRAIFKETGLFDYIYSMFLDRIFVSDTVDDYLLMKNIVNDVIELGLEEDSHIKVIDIEYTDDASFARMLAKVLRSEAKNLGFFNTSTLSGLENVTNINNQSFITTPVVEAILDVDVLSGAFNIDKANSEQRLAIIDYFDDEDVLGVIASNKLIQQWDTYVSMEPDIYNPSGLYRNHYYHHQAIYSHSKFENMVIIRKKPSGEEIDARNLASAGRKAPTKKQLLTDEALEKGFELTGKETIPELEVLLAPQGEDNSEE